MRHANAFVSAADRQAIQNRNRTELRARRAGFDCGFSIAKAYIESLALRNTTCAFPPVAGVPDGRRACLGNRMGAGHRIRSGGIPPQCALADARALHGPEV